MESILVVILLVGSLNIDSDVIGLTVIENCQFSPKMTEVETGNFLVKVLGKSVHLVLVFMAVLVFPELQLGKGLVAEGVGHHEAGVASGASEVE